MIESIGVGMIGHGFMGKAHSIGYRDVSAIAPTNVPRPRLVDIFGRNLAAMEEVKDRYGWEHVVADWRTIVANDAIQLVDNVGPNSLHVEPSIAAAAAGKHVYCEKPLAPSASDAHRMWQAVARAGVKHMCGFNYRFFPALQLARQIVESGELGEIFHFRSNFLLSSSFSSDRSKTWRDDRATAGSGALGDLGSHHIDLSRFLLASDPVSVSGLTRIVVGDSHDGRAIETDDLFAAILQYDKGAIGVLEASRVAGGHLVTSRIEIDGSKGSLQFSLNNVNELRVSGVDQAFRCIPVLREGDPYQMCWFPAGHPLGWVDTFSHEAIHILGAIAGLHDVMPIGATFRDGYYCAEVVESILLAAREGRTVPVVYRPLMQ